jgi:hypothetical protein
MGDCFVLRGHKSSTVELDLQWNVYREFMSSHHNFSLEYKLATADLACGCWSDAELTVFGGQPEKMLKVLDSNGGREAMMLHMERDFCVDGRPEYKEMYKYLRGLLFEDER